MERINLADLIGQKELQKIIESFESAFNMSAAITDIHGKLLTSPKKISELCGKVIRNTESGELACQRSDAIGGRKAINTGKPSIYICRGYARNIDFAVPVFVKGEPIGFMLGGQVNTKLPDEKECKARAMQYGLDPKKFWRAARKTKIMPLKKIKAAAELLNTIGKLVSTYADNIIIHKEINVNLRKEVKKRTLKIRFQNIKLRNLAMTDRMTNLLTHSEFLKNVAQESKRMGRMNFHKYKRKSKKYFFMILLDVDRFKRINDTFGHLMGDLVIKRMGQIIKSSIRGIDIAGRYGGDEFSILLPETDLERGMVVVKRIKSEVESLKFSGNNLVKGIVSSSGNKTRNGLTVSFGVTESDGSHSPEEVIKTADEALYQAKRKGRNRVEVKLFLNTQS